MLVVIGNFNCQFLLLLIIAQQFPEPTGPRHAHKLTEDILALLRPRAATMSSTELAAWLREAHQLIVHPRSIERALARAAKKGGSQ